MVHFCRTQVGHLSAAAKLWMQKQFATIDPVMILMRDHVSQAERDIAHIYRVRNNIAHGGAFGPRLPLLRYGIRIAHDYLKTLIENLLFHVGRERGLGMSDVLMSSETTYNTFQGAKAGTIDVTDVVGARALFIDMR